MGARRIAEIIAMAFLLVILVLVVVRRVEDEAVTGTPAPSVVSASTTPASTPTPTPTPVPSATPEPTVPPEPTPTPRPALELDGWQLRLVNKENLMGEEDRPEVTELEGGQYFDTRAVEALREMIAAARAEGLYVRLTSAYRPYDTQMYLYNKKVTEVQGWYGYDLPTAQEAAKAIVAYPGSSEHQLGLACDIVDGYYQYMDESLADTELLQWLAEHCTTFGFVLRYPKDKTEITGIMYEPWHFRYVGLEAAVYMTENGLCLEELHERYAAQGA